MLAAAESEVVGGVGAPGFCEDKYREESAPTSPEHAALTTMAGKTARVMGEGVMGPFTGN